MKRKIIQLEVETELTNKELKVKELWQIRGAKIIQVKVNTIKREVK